ncbi:9267_t:CDS:2 [Gigaspora rosea]|nr:9267_t:CDS:2 [Gigaspora rosea]
MSSANFGIVIQEGEMEFEYVPKMVHKIEGVLSRFSKMETIGILKDPLKNNFTQRSVDRVELSEFNLILIDELYLNLDLIQFVENKLIESLNNAKGSEPSSSEQTDPTDFAKKDFKVIKNNQQQLAAINSCLINTQIIETGIINYRTVKCCLVFTYIIGKDKNLSSSEARYQEIEIIENDYIYDILKKIDRLYLLPYKLTILLAPDQDFHPKNTITTTTDINVWDVCFPHDPTQPHCQFFGFIAQNMNYCFATLLEFCEICSCWGTHFESICRAKGPAKNKRYL